MTFRKVEKEALPAQVPIEIARMIRERAGRERRSMSAVATELLCIGLGRDPGKFGIETTQVATATA